jgi:hypothetical protein
MRPGQRGSIFDGTSDYLVRTGDLTGIADSKVGIVSTWIKPTVDGALGNIIHGSNADVQFTKTATNTCRMYLRDALNAVMLDISTGLVLAASGWTHVMMSWDVAAATSHVYKDGVSDKTETTNDDKVADLTQTNWGIGATNVGTTPFGGALAELYFTNEYLDLSVAANRKKFISDTGKPVSLGPDGSWPTGTAAIIYMPRVDGPNFGTGGDFTVAGSPYLVRGSGGLNPKKRD